ncbi:Ubiquitin-like domain-containing protein [Mycena venus]|uniref:Ubiquitin-like domain-containing protein n=1 Tax=Mycena venus TaxID=2733690 RepID=A0A8H7D7X9_9AGAR|nr:Ubiquitin-like domain-containing protein [Mycena venus]
MQPLSEKAKGKQRAIELPDAGHVQSSDPVASRDLVIRFPEGTPDLRVVVTERDTLKDVKTMIRRERSPLKTKRLRFIHSGRLLADTTLVHSWLVELDEKRKQTSVEDDPAPPISATTWIHCSIGREIEDGEDEEGNEQQKAQLQPARGFDRLASVGFSEADIANFRQQFHSQSASNYLDTDFETEEEYDEHARALEEEWIDSLDSAGSSLSQNSSNNPAFLQGVLLGFFFPILPFFFFRNNHPPAVFWDNGGLI